MNQRLFAALEVTKQKLRGVLRLPIRPLSPDHLIAGFLDACRAAANPIVVFPEWSTHADTATVYLTRTGSGALRSAAALAAMLQCAAADGWAYTPGFRQYAPLLAVRGDLTAGWPNDPREWFTLLANGSTKTYLNQVRKGYQNLDQPMREAFLGALSEVRHPPFASVLFEAANVCNLACPMCTRNIRALEEGLMDAGRAMHVISELAAPGWKFTLYPHFLGETLMHPRYFDILDHALKFPNIEVRVISNGLVLDERRREELLARPIYHYTFSIHECDQAKQRGVAPWLAESTRNVLEFLRRAVETGKRESLFVDISMVAESLQDPAGTQFRDYWLGIANEVLILCYLDNGVVPDPDILGGLEGRRFPCTSPWSQPVVAYDGSVLPCCRDYEHSMVMGNAFEESFDQIWTGAKFVALREAMLTGDLTNYPTCQNCDTSLIWLPAHPTTRMGEFYFTSNGCSLGFGSLALDDVLLKRRIAELPAAPQCSHLPIYRR